MSKDPYQVLGVSKHATDEEIKHAYHELARKYHPDRYTNSDLADLAKEKMQEVNEAYDAIQRQRAAGGADRDAGQKNDYGSDRGGYSGNGPGAGNYNGQNYSAEAREKFVLIRNCINSGNITEAQRLLEEIEQPDRGAEWYFLTGCVQMRNGFYMDAQYSFDTAYRMEPTNNEYWQFKEKMRERSRSYSSRGSNAPHGGGCDSCDVCSSLLCADCCCECMGGDLIPCC